jgi:hypothetical protein
MLSRPFLAALLIAQISAQAQVPEPVLPVLKEFCLDCHNAKKQKGDLDLEPLLADPKFTEHRETWEKALDLLNSREMPPEKKPQPSDEQRQLLTQYIDGALTKLDADTVPNPGKVTLRRLNKEEYRRTVFDLLRVDFQPDDFPNDEVGYGFNNIGDVLSISPMLMEKYLAAAEQIAKKAIVIEAAVKVPKQRLRGDRFAAVSDLVRPLENHVLGLYREGESSLEADFIRTGDYILRFRAFGEQAGPEAPKMRVKFDGKELDTFDVKNEKPKPFEVRVKAEAGRHPIAVAYLNNYVDQTNSDLKLRGDRNLFVDSVEIEGPLDGKPAPMVAAIEARRWKVPKGAELVDGKALLFASGAEAVAEVNFSVKDEYLIRVHAYGEQAGDELPKLKVTLGGKELRVFEINATRGGEDVHDVRVSVEAGKQPLGVAFVNDFYDPAHKADRNLWVPAVEIVGPINSASPDLPEAHRRIVTKMPKPGDELNVAREILAPFAARAYRRSATDADVDRLVSFVSLSLKNRGSFLEGIQAAVQAALCSPQFLFRWELDPDAIKPGEIRHLSDYEVASRLSYFLWSSMPDDELFALAEKGELLKDGNLEKQVPRMLKDWRSHALVENFGGQWLQIHNIYEVDPDPKTFPNFSPELREDMRRETFAFFEAIMKEDRSIFDLIDADFTFLNERLAAHYGIEGVKGGEFQRVALPKDSPRGGVLAQGAVLLSTSMPTRTSPVIRGKWILEQILGTPPPPPPANVPPLDGKNVDLNAPLRKRLEQHRENPDCAGCHAKMDPLGFALENFDALGAWRTMDGKNPIDASATLPNGTALNGPAELKKILHGDKFERAFAQKMMIFALGRGLERYDKSAVEAVVAKTKAGDHKFSVLVTAIVTSDPFLKRKAETKLAGSQ